MKWFKYAVVLCVFALSVPLARATQGTWANSGGSSSAASGITISAVVTEPAGLLTINCPATGAGTCAGGSQVRLLRNS